MPSRIAPARTHTSPRRNTLVATAFVAWGLFASSANPASASRAPDWFPAEVSVLDTSPSFIDMRPLLQDAPAGKHGFLQVRGDSFVFEDGTPGRFWGTNLTFGGTLPPAKNAPAVAAALAKRGFNWVRFHHLDTADSPRGLIDYGPEGRTVDPEMLARFDHLVAALTREGIHYGITLYTGGRFDERDGAPMKIGPQSKFAMHWIRPVLEAQGDFAASLLDRRNTVTGIRYADDPALILLELLNEASIFNLLKENVTREGNAHFPAALSRPLLDRWHRWLRDRHGTQEQLVRAWGGARALGKGESLDRNSVALPSPRNSSRMTPGRLAESVEFLSEMQEESLGYLRERIQAVGTRIPITGTHSFGLLPSLVSLSKFDYIDTHGYWNPPRGKKQNRAVRTEGQPGSSLIDVPAYFQRHGRAFHEAPIPLWATSRIKGMPLVVSEWNQPWPSPHAFELPAIAAAYGSFLGFNGMGEFCHAESREQLLENGALIQPFADARSPVRRALAPINALVFLRQDTTPSRSPWILRYGTEDVFPASKHRLEADDRLFWGKDFPFGGSLVHRIEREFVDAKRGGNPSPPVANGPDFLSDTGELHWTGAIGKAPGLVRIATVRTSGVVGGIPGEKRSAGAIEVTCEERGAILATSLDGTPLDQSDRILVAAVGHEKNTGQVLSPSGKIESTGRAPVLAQAIHGTVEIRRAPGAKPLRAWALDLTGAPIGSAPCQMTPGGLKLELGGHPALLYALSVEPPVGATSIP